MDIITIEGDALRALLHALAADLMRGPVPYRIRVARDVDGVKFKLDEGIWSPPYPIADEDAQRDRMRPPERGWPFVGGSR
jgi:hypothetical protein